MVGKAMDENPTRNKIIMLLNRAEHQTVAELSQQMDITPMAVRQHLMALERKGIISYVAKKYGIGRPVFLYSLTSKAKSQFPKAYSTFIRDVLAAIGELEGKEKIDRIFRLRKERQVEEKKKALSKTRTFNEKIRTFARLLDEEGFMVEVEDGTRKVMVKQFNCMLSDVASEYPQACKHELDFYRDLFGRDVERSQCQREGAPCCVYEISKG